MFGRSREGGLECEKFGTCEKKEKTELFCADFAAIAAVDAWEFRLPEMEQHL